MNKKEIATVRMREGRVVDPAALAVKYRVPARDEERNGEKAAYAEAERRLYAIRPLRARVEEAREELAVLEGIGADMLAQAADSYMRVLRPGTCVDPGELHAAQLSALRGQLAVDERELRRMNAALDFIREDPYFEAVEGRYVHGMSDGILAERLCCDPSTVRRNRRRLVRMVALRLYGTGGTVCLSSC